jgi:hypothetical protein
MPPQSNSAGAGPDVIDQLQNTRAQLNNAHMTISNMERDLMFWKRLALKKLGVTADDIRELVQPTGFGGVSTMPSGSIGRGY